MYTYAAYPPGRGETGLDDDSVGSSCSETYKRSFLSFENRLDRIRVCHDRLAA
jgi:hypothetical protein